MNKSPAESVLQRIAADKQAEIEARKQARPLSDWQDQVRPIAPGALERAFRRPDRPVRLMLEVKPASPSAGVLAETLDETALVAAYNRYGCAISVLTDQKYFGGSLNLLSRVAQRTDLPVLCKDFVLDAYQIDEARLAGASAVLLIVKMLADSQLAELAERTRQLGLTPLIEIQNETELERALPLAPSILLINNRNLDTLAMDMQTTARLSPLIPQDILRVSASGISSRADIEALRPYCDGFLVGSALMREPVERAEAMLADWSRA